MSGTSRGRFQGDRQRICLVGASVRALAESAVASGFDVVAVDLFADADLIETVGAENVRVVPDLDGTLTSLAHAPPASMWAYAGGLENRPRSIERLARSMRTLGCSLEAIALARNPEHLSQAIGRAGLLYASLDGDRSRGRWLSKPRRGSAGRGIRLARSAERSSRRRYIQRWIDGQAASALYLARPDGVETIGVARQWFGVEGVGPFAFAGAWVCPEYERRHLEAATRIGEVVARDCALVGLFGVDFIVDADDLLWVVEVNPRWTSSAELYERLGRGPLAARHVAACLGESDPRPKDAGDASKIVGKRIEHADFSGTADPVATAAAMARRHAENSVADIPAAGSIVVAGAPLLTVFGAASPRSNESEIDGRLRTQGKSWCDAFRPKVLSPNGLSERRKVSPDFC